MDKYSQNPHLYTISNSLGTQATIMDWGATLVDVSVKIKKTNETRSLVINLNPSEYDKQYLYVGATIGRFANRIANGKFTINNKKYSITNRHNTKHVLHGGNDAFDQRRFKVIKQSKSEVTLYLKSPHLDQGFPGNLDFYVTYSIDEDNNFKISYKGKSDMVTPLNITSHAYWNLNSKNCPIKDISAFGHKIWVKANKYLPLDAEGIPTGEFKDVENSIFDLRKLTTITKELVNSNELKPTHGFDHPFVIDDISKPFAYLESDDGLVSFLMSTNYPSAQVYFANFFAHTPSSKQGEEYSDYSSVAIEPEYYPDFVNNPKLSKDCPLLKPGEEFNKFINIKLIVK